MTDAGPTVTLRRDWDYRPRLGDPRGHHAIRREEQAAVADFVERRDEGSLLVVGRRGSGKTSMVIAAVNEAARRRPQGKTILPILVRATSIEPDGAIGKKQLLVSLVRSLQRAVSGNRGARRMRKQVRDLHDNATATAKSRVRTTSATLTWSAGYGMLPPYVMAALLLLLPDVQWVAEHGWAAIVMMLAPLLALAGRWAVRDRVAASSRHDYGFDDIQCEFELVLHKHAATHKVVFILDEFDKVGGGQTASAVMAPLKMLINQGGALYVFITSPDRIGNIEYRQGVDYTVFSDILYVKRSLFGEMEGFIDNIVEEKSADLADDQYADLRCHLCYKAKADFFDLHRAIRDRRSGTDEHGRPVLNAALDGREKTAANLQRAIKYVYDRKAYGSLSKQRDNEEMLEIMYDLSAKSESMLNETITISGRKIGVGGTTEEYSQHESSAARDLFMLLSDEGYASNNGDDFTIKGTLSAFRGVTHVEEERAFADAYDLLLDDMAGIANCKSFMDGHGERFGEGAAEEQWDDLVSVVAAATSVFIPDELRRCRLRIGEPGTPSAPPDELRRHTDQARHALAEIRTRSVDLVARAFELYLGISTAPDVTPPFGLAFAANLVDQVYNAVADHPAADNEIRLAIFDAQKASTTESLRSFMVGIDGVVNEAVVLLVGDNAPASLEQSFFVIDSIESIDRLTIDAMVRARDCGAYGFILKPPLTMRKFGLVLYVIDSVKAHRRSGTTLNFELEWDSLKSLASGQANVTARWFAGKRARMAKSGTQGGELP